MAGGRSGTDSLIALVISSGCPVCTDSENIGELRELLYDMRAQRSSNSRLRFLGVAVDTDPRDGYRLLQQIRGFR